MGEQVAPARMYAINGELDTSGIYLVEEVDRVCEVLQAEAAPERAGSSGHAPCGTLSRGHYQIRSRGTVGGSLAHADPAAEPPGVAVTCDCTITLVGPAGSRAIGAGEFFIAPLSTVRKPDEIITELRLPLWPPDRRWGFEEFARREGDFALAGILLFYDPDRAGRVENAHVGVIGACDRPHRLRQVEALLNGHNVEDSLIRRAAAAGKEEVDPRDDLHADAAYRRGLVVTLIERALRTAAQSGGL